MSEQRLIHALHDVLEAFDVFLEWVEGDNVNDPTDLDKLNGARERGRALLDEIGAYDDQKRN